MDLRARVCSGSEGTESSLRRAGIPYAPCVLRQMIRVLASMSLHYNDFCVRAASRKTQCLRKLLRRPHKSQRSRNNGLATSARNMKTGVRFAHARWQIPLHVLDDRHVTSTAVDSLSMAGSEKPYPDA